MGDYRHYCWNYCCKVGAENMKWLLKANLYMTKFDLAIARTFGLNRKHIVQLEYDVYWIESKLFLMELNK